MNLNHHRLWHALMWALVGAILVLALLPNPPEPIDTGWDKTNHLLAFVTLGLVASLAHASRWRWAALLGYGVLIELLQALTPHREASTADVVADALGLALAAGLWWLWCWGQRLRQR